MLLSNRETLLKNAQPIEPLKTLNTLIVVPCYNEALRLNVASFLAYLETNAELGFVFVNDGSSDKTLDLLLDMQAKNPVQIKILSLGKNSGKAEAVRHGLIYASNYGAEYTGYWDADLATPLDAIDDLKRVATKFSRLSVIFGSRQTLLGHQINRDLNRRIVSKVCAVMARQALGLPIGDTQCGAKLLKNTSELRESIVSPFTAGWLFDVELFSRISTKLPNSEDAFYEYPLAQWDEFPGSKISTSDIVKSGLQMLRLIFRAKMPQFKRSATSETKNDVAQLAT